MSIRATLVGNIPIWSTNIEHPSNIADFCHNNRDLIFGTDQPHITPIKKIAIEIADHRLFVVELVAEVSSRVSEGAKTYHVDHVHMISIQDTSAEFPSFINRVEIEVNSFHELMNIESFAVGNNLKHTLIYDTIYHK